MTASALMSRLPTFPDATVDELLDIRTELADPLAEFRSAMVSIANGFTSEAWEKDFVDEVRDAWVAQVSPAVQAIELAVRDNRSLLTMAANFGGAANAAVPGLAIVAAGLAGHAGAVAELGGGISVAAPLLNALKDRTSNAREIRMRPFYFLYKVHQKLGRG